MRISNLKVGKMKKIVFSLIPLMFISCSLMFTYKPVDDVAVLDVKFGFYKWNGIEIPIEGISIKCGGDGISPDFYVSNIPIEANAIVVEYEDSELRKLGYSVSNGSYWVPTEGKSEVYIQSVIEGAVELPEGVHEERQHSGVKVFNESRGVYRAPNSCVFTNDGTGSRYFAHIKAVYKPYNKEDQGLLLGYAFIELGTF